MHTAKAKKTRLGVIEGGAQPTEIESKYRVLFDQASDAILTVLPTGAIDAANRATEEMTGYLKSELEGLEVDKLFPDVGKHRIPDRARPLTRELLRTEGTYEDIAISRKDGYVRLVDVSVRRVADGVGPLSVALFRDVTEKKQMERELITKHTELRNAYFELQKNNAELKLMQETLVQAGKMAALGELAAGIAHELNQPLQGIRGYAQELQALSQQNAQAAEFLREIVSNVDKMASIISYLRAFTRKSTENYEMADVHRSIEEALKMLSRQFAARGIEVERVFKAKPAQLYGNPLQLEQVFINLATNARDAIEQTGRGKGKIQIVTRNVGEFIEITFRDDGCGMTEKTRQKIFNPFFTTKDVGRGMGLGLSISYGILSKLHGSILVESELGKGTAFLVRLPRDFRELA